MEKNKQGEAKKETSNNSNNKEEESLLTQSNAEEKSKRSFLRKNKYNKGLCNNFQEVFGKNPLLWILPINCKNANKGGYNFDVFKIEKKLKENLKTNINLLKEKTFSFDLKPDSIEKNAKDDW